MHGSHPGGLVAPERYLLLKVVAQRACGVNSRGAPTSSSSNLLLQFDHQRRDGALASSADAVKMKARWRRAYLSRMRQLLLDYSYAVKTSWI